MPTPTGIMDYLTGTPIDTPIAIMATNMKDDPSLPAMNTGMNMTRCNTITSIGLTCIIGIATQKSKGAGGPVKPMITATPERGWANRYQARIIAVTQLHQREYTF